VCAFCHCISFIRKRYLLKFSLFNNALLDIVNPLLFNIYFLLTDIIMKAKQCIKLCLAAFIFISLAGCDKVQPKSETNSLELQALAAHQVLERLAQKPLPQIKFSLVNSEQEEVIDWYQVSAQQDGLTVAANSASALTYGTYRYLKKIGAMSVSWEGSRIDIPEQFSPYSGDKTSANFKLRSYLNVCAYGYSTPWWQWQRWQQEIDWMAIHGVNNPVAMEGQEYVWQALWQEFDISDEELTRYFSGPAFTPWHRMGNVEAHRGVLPQSWINKKHQLQVRILARMSELGMDPVLPAFAGYVPKAFLAKFPQAKIYTMEPWSGFDKETYWLDPADPLFAQVAKRFLEIYNHTYGEGKYYLSDSFNEMKPPVSVDKRYEELAHYGEAIYQSIHQVVPNATWVMQGWMFGADKDFWDHQSIAAFLSKVPNEQAMVHDIGNDRYQVWQGANAFHNKQWVYGFIHNYGASNPIYGDFTFYQQQVDGLLSANNTGQLNGFGAFPEGIDNNSVVYDFMYDLAWQKDNAGEQNDVATWLNRHTAARYGKPEQLEEASLTVVQVEQKLQHAWQLIAQSVYGTKYWQSRWWQGSAGAYLLFKRPNVNLTQFVDHPGDMLTLKQGITALLAVSPYYQQSPLFLQDLVDFYRHYVTMHIDKKIQQTIKLYQQGNSSLADEQVRFITELVNGLDLLLGIQPQSLATWLDDARQYATSPDEANYFISNAKAQVTIWGGDSLKDYASKAWQGMYKDFYLPRWHLFFEQLKQHAQRKDTSEQQNSQTLEKALITWEKNWLADSVHYRQTIPQQPVVLMKSLLEMLAEQEKP